MNKMFLTRYPISLSSDKPIEKLGYILIPITKKRCIASFASTISSFDYEVVGGYFEDINNNEVSYKKYTQAKGKDLIDKAPYYVVPDGDNCGIYISNKYDITRFSNTPDNVDYAFSDKECNFLRYCTSLETLTSNSNEGINLNKIIGLTKLTLLGNWGNYGEGFIGDIANLKNLTDIVMLHLQNTAVSGDIANLKNLTKLNLLSLASTAVSGDIANLKNLTDIVELYLQNTAVSGDIANLKNLTDIVELHLQNTAVSGDIANLKNLTELNLLSLTNTAVSGDIANLKNLTKLKSWALSGTAVSGDITNLLTSDMPLSGISFGNNTNITGDLSTINLRQATSFTCSGTFRWSKVRSGEHHIVYLTNDEVPLNLGNDIDIMLQDAATAIDAGQNTELGWGGNVIYAIGNKTSASDSYVSTLQSKGVTIVIKQS